VKRLAWVALFFVLPTSLTAQTELKRKALAHTPSFSVTVEKLRENAVDAGLDENQLKVDAELRLREAHIKLVDDPAPDAYLYIWVNTLKVGEEGWVFQVHVGFNEYVTLHNKKQVYAETWHTGGLGTTTNLVSKIRGAVGDDVDEFINDYLAANQ
jgi:hypothetical protein